MMGEAAARLLIKTAGTVASMINADDDCGFEDTLGVLLWPSDVQGDDGDMGSITWEVEGCALEKDGVVSRDCSGTRTCVAGSAVVDATRTVSGERDTLYWLVDSVIPRDPEAVRIRLDRVQLEGFATYDLLTGELDPEVKLTVLHGQLSGTVQPILGENREDPGTYDVATPVAIFSDLSFQGQLLLQSGAKSMLFEVEGAKLSAQNGYYDGQGNILSGNITVDDRVVQLGEGPLNPDYDQQDFDASYQCTEDLAYLISP